MKKSHDISHTDHAANHMESGAVNAGIGEYAANEMDMPGNSQGMNDGGKPKDHVQAPPAMGTRERMSPGGKSGLVYPHRATPKAEGVRQAEHNQAVIKASHKMRLKHNHQEDGSQPMAGTTSR